MGTCGLRSSWLPVNFILKINICNASFSWAITLSKKDVDCPRLPKVLGSTCLDDPEPREDAYQEFTSPSSTHEYKHPN
ncbi:hypothetical protein EUGRSUZ_I01559 [Eucalyptus grandis]|uniref:Uncharacterized protein n=2 Tax=Eucalyptus grandis TaxID=71139 RepID=A0A059APU8_EUCGR|nr:hypothetical protein EUGRSUZ_I01559 [Eucalyptus grandis]